VGAKAAGFAALVRVFTLAFPTLSSSLIPVLWVVAAATMILGNVVAISQTNIKRLLAYSSIGQAGYILMGLLPYGQATVAKDVAAATAFYMAAYALTSFTAWAVVIALEKVHGPDGESSGLQISDYAGLGRRYPALGFAMAVAMFSFTGVPPTVGFLGKFYLFGLAIAGGYTGLAVIGVLTSLVSAFYYLRIVVIMFMQDGKPEVRQDPWLVYTALATAAATLLLGVLAGPMFNLATNATIRLF
jgi:NADH-quinone oxidoreductase subunit N